MPKLCGLKVNGTRLKKDFWLRELLFGLNRAQVLIRGASLKIGPLETDTMEIVFNRGFGDPQLKIGDAVKGCGDVIVSKEETDRYLPSPDGAIIHYLHMSNGANHPDGYIKVGDHIYGEKPEAPDSSVPSDIAVTRSLDVPANAPCFAVDSRGIVKNQITKKMAARNDNSMDLFQMEATFMRYLTKTVQQLN